MRVERDCVGAVENVDAPVAFGWDVVVAETGVLEAKRAVVDGWLLPLLEAKRIQACEFSLPASLSR
jgi:midasin